MKNLAASTWHITSRRVLIPVFLVQFIGWVDRTNLGFAALQMNKDLALSPEVFGLGAGIFFFGLVCLEVPSSYFLLKVGASRWLSRIMITWGLAACAMALVSGPKSFYLVRFLLGTAEAGLAVSVTYHMRNWFPADRRARAAAVWIAGGVVASVIAGPVSTALMSLDAFGLRGWQWMFIVEGVPAILLGVVFPRIAPEGPDQAAWLPEENRQWLKTELVRQQADLSGVHPSFRAGLTSSVVWILAIPAAAIGFGSYGLFFWLPQIIKAGFSSLSLFQIGLVSALPYIGAFLVMLLCASSSDRSFDRRWHLAVLGLTGGVGLALGVLTTDPVIGFLSLCVAISCVFAYIGIYWSVAISVLPGAAAASGAALLNAISNIGGFVGPSLVGFLRGYTGSFNIAIASFALAFVAMGLTPLVVPRFFPGLSRTGMTGSSMAPLLEQMPSQ